MKTSKPQPRPGPQQNDRKPLVKLQEATPGCRCSRCHRIRGIKKDGPPDPRTQGGRVQQAANELGWSDGGDSEGGGNRLLGHEAAEREYREQRGIRELPAAFRYLVGSAPKLQRSDFAGARAFLINIMRAIEHGGWTRSEWARLYRMRDKWKRRAEGGDARFNEMGNRTGGMSPEQQSRVKLKQAIGGIMSTLQSEVPGGGSRK